ncbi:MAG TPA: hypothetical protein ENI27_02575 [bacterium]|nr:hypothetical protein [bacterium]
MKNKLLIILFSAVLAGCASFSPVREALNTQPPVVVRIIDWNRNPDKARLFDPDALDAIFALIAPEKSPGLKPSSGRIKIIRAGGGGRGGYLNRKYLEAVDVLAETLKTHWPLDEVKVLPPGSPLPSTGIIIDLELGAWDVPETKDADQRTKKQRQLELLFTIDIHDAETRERLILYPSSVSAMIVNGEYIEYQRDPAFLVEKLKKRVRKTALRFITKATK